MKRFLLITFIITLSTSLFAREYKIKAVNTNVNEVSEVYGESVSTVTTNNNIEISLSMAPTKNNEIRVCVDIKNLGDSTYRFDERDIRVYYGNHESDSWKSEDFITPTEYYEKAENDVEFNNVMAAVGLGLILLDSGLPPPVYFSPRNRIKHNRHPRHYTIEPIPHEHHSDPAFVGLGIANLLMTVDEGESTLDYLRDHLLYNAEIEPNEGYSGIFFIPVSKGPDYKISLRIGNGEVADFVFKRTDRERIIHPWADTNDTKVAFTFYPGLQYDNGFVFTYGMNCLWLTKGIGGYFGFSYGEGNVIGYDNEELIEFGGGITTKLCPHVWFTGGLSAQYQNLYEDMECTKSIWTMGPDLGLNFNWGWVDLGIETKYRLFNAWEASVGFGFSL